MPGERTLPIAAEHREFTVKVDGQEMPRAHQLLAVSVTKQVDKISAARLTYLDGAAATSDFPLSHSGLLAPGAEIEILAGAQSDRTAIFHGLVVRLALRLREQGAPSLQVDCRHAATRLTIGRKSRVFTDGKDSEAAASLCQAAGLTAELEATTVIHPQLVQYHTSDWDFLLARARANGQGIFTNDRQLKIQKPRLDGEPRFTLQFGSTLLELDAEIDARHQVGTIKSRTWDPGQQELVEKAAADPGFTPPGRFSADQLAAVAAPEEFLLDHAALREDEAQAWADACRLRAQVNQVVGRAKCVGIATVNPGDLVTLDGVGSAFSGKIYVTGVRQDFDTTQGWKTHLQFGGLEPRDGASVESSGPASTNPLAGALLPGVQGLQVGVVLSNEDPGGEFRVLVRLPLVSADEGIWARVACPDAGADRGFCFRPEVGDEVTLGFLEGDPRQAIVLGMLHSSAKAAPLPGSDKNHEKLYQSRSKLRFHLDDDKKNLLLETPGGHRLVLSDEKQELSLADSNGNRVVLGPDGIQLHSAKAIEIQGQTEVKLASGTSCEIQGGSELKLSGASSAELSSAAVAKVKGGLVQIN